MKTIKITEKILLYIKKENKYVTYFEFIPSINSIWKVENVTSYPNVNFGEPVIEVSNANKWMRLPLSIVKILKDEQTN